VILPKESRINNSKSGLDYLKSRVQFSRVRGSPRSSEETSLPIRRKTAISNKNKRETKTFSKDILIREAASRVMWGKKDKLVGKVIAEQNIIRRGGPCRARAPSKKAFLIKATV